MSLLLYALTAVALLALAHRFARPLSRSAAVVLFFLPFVFTGHALLTDRVLAPIDYPYNSEPLKSMAGEFGIGMPHNGVLTDIYCQIMPWRRAVQWSYAQRQWPLWNPFILCGDILAAAAQPAPYSPFTLLACLLPIGKSFTFTAALTFFIAGLGAFLFARELGCGERASFIAAAGWMVSAGITLYLLWPLAICWALLPLVLFATRRVVVEPGVRSWALLTSALTMLLLSGHPETMLYVTVIGAAYGVFELARHRANAARTVALALAAGVVTLLLCAIYVLPILEAMPQTADYGYRAGALAQHPRGVSDAKAVARLATDFFPFLHAREWVSPKLGVLNPESAAVGSILVALAIYALWRVRSATAWFFAALGVFCFAAHVEWAPLARMLQKLPRFMLSVNDRLSFAAAFCLVVLAALGSEEIVRRRGDRTAVALTLSSVFAVLLVGNVFILRRLLLAQGFAAWGEHAMFAELALLGAAVILFAIPWEGVERAAPRFLLPSLLALILVQRLIEDGGTYRSFPARAAYPPVALFEPLKKVREPFRIVGQKFAFVPGANVMYGLEDVRGYEAMTNALYASTFRLWCEPQPIWFNRVDDLTRPFLSMMNVRFAVAERDAGIPQGWRKVGEQGNAVLLENANAADRVFVPRRVRVGIEDGEAIDQMSSQDDFRQLGWIAAPLAPHERDNGPGRVTIRPANLGFRLAVEMENEGWVVVSETAWKGWRAYLDGRRVQMQRGNVAFLAVFVPRGRHDLRLVYWPQSFVIGRVTTAAALAGLMVFAVVRRRRRLPTGGTGPGSPLLNDGHASSHALSSATMGSGGWLSPCRAKMDRTSRAPVISLTECGDSHLSPMTSAGP